MTETNLRKAAVATVKAMGRACVHEVAEALKAEGHVFRPKQIVQALQNAKTRKQVITVGFMPKSGWGKGRTMVIYEVAPPKEKPAPYIGPRPASSVWEFCSREGAAA